MAEARHHSMDGVLERLAQIAPSTLGHFLDEGFLDPLIQPLYRPIHLVGRALTVDSPPRDNGILRRAIREAGSGDVLVIRRGSGSARSSSKGREGSASQCRCASEPVGGLLMLFMVIERFKNRDAKAIYRRLRDKGRGMPDGLRYVNSWIEASFDRCFQLMECDDVRLFQQWITNWSDLMEFEIVPVAPSSEVREAIETTL